MSSELEISVDMVEIVVGLVFLVVAGYTGFRLSRIQGSRTYRRRALWMGLSSVVFVPVFIQILLFYFVLMFDAGYLPPFLPGFSYGNPSLFYVATLSQYYVRPIAIGTFFGFVFSTIRVALDQDYLHRDTLRWGRVRWLALTVSEGNAILQFLAYVGYSAYIFSLTQIGIVQIVGTPTNFYVSTTPMPMPPIVIALLLTATGFSVYLLAVLAVGSARTSDPVIKRHAVWLSLAVASVIVSLLEGNYFPNPFDSFPLAVGAIFWYQASRSLSPTSKKEGGLALS